MPPPPRRSAILVLLLASAACGAPPAPDLPDAGPRRDAAAPCEAADLGEAQPGLTLVSGRYLLTWVAPCGLGAINPLAADEVLDLDVAAGTVSFSDRDGGCGECAAVHHGTVRGACLEVDGATFGASKVLDPYALCPTVTGIAAIQVWSGYPGPADPAGWRLHGVRP